MAPKVYMNKMSAPCRAVMMVVRALDLNDVEYVHVGVENIRSPEMLQLNPQHTIPTLVDDDFVVWDSHAIAGYLIGKYAEDDALYPAEVNQRALIDQYLHFDGSVLFTRTAALLRPVLFEDSTEFTVKAIEALEEAYGFLDAFLANNRDWLVGEDVTIADLCILTCIATTDLVFPVDEEKYPQLYAWYQRGKELPYYEEVNREGLDELKTVLHTKLGKDL